MNSQSIAEMTAAYEAQYGVVETLPNSARVLTYGFNNKPVKGPMPILRKTAKTQKVLAHIEKHPDDHAALIAVATGVSYDRVRYVALSHGIQLPRAVCVAKPSETPQADMVRKFMAGVDSRKVSIAEIAKATGVSETCARETVKSLGLKIKRLSRGRAPVMEENVIKAAREDLTSYQIAALAGCTPDYARRVMRERGIKYMSARK